MDANGQKITTLDLATIMPTSLIRLTLHSNQLSGTIPDLSSLSSLQYLYLHDNQLTGTIPTSLTHLYLHTNQLTGTIPALPASLRWLQLQDNQLTGTLTNLTDLNPWALYLHNNQLSGPIPEFPNSNEHFRLSLYGNPDLYGYPAALDAKTLLRLLAPGDGTAVCLPTTSGGTDCTVPTVVDKLRVQASPTQLVFSWEPNPAAPAPAGYAAQYYPPDGPWTDVQVTGTTARITGLTPEATYSLLVWTTATTTATPPNPHPTQTTPRLYYVVTLPESAPPPPPGNRGGGGGGGGTRRPPDQHGDTPAEATALNPPRYTTGYLRRRLDARLQSRTDVDYFTLDLPHAGVLLARTTGGDTTGRLYQAQADGAPVLIATDTDSGTGRNFRLGVAVEPGTYYLAVSAGTSFGAYRLGVDYTPAFVDNPAPNAPQSGLGVLSGWVCATTTVEIELVPDSGEPQLLAPATNTSRADTAGVCGAATTATGYGLLFNWNLLGDGAHTVRVLINDVVFAERAITVTTLGDHPEQEYRRGLRATTDLPDFPAAGETTTLRWAEALQNFVLADGEGSSDGEQLTPEQAWLENPAPGSFQSGLGVISGWVCEADTVEIVFEPGGTDETLTFETGSGTERADTADRCGDTDNGFGLLFNWNLLGDGTHTVRALADGDEFAHSTVTVTTLDGEFARGLRQTHDIADFPSAGQTTTVEWREGQQNFVITGVE